MSLLASILRPLLVVSSLVAATGCLGYREVHGIGFAVDFDYGAIAPGAPILVTSGWATCHDSSYIVGHAEIDYTVCDPHDYTASYRCVGVACQIVATTGAMSVCGTSSPSDPTFFSCGRDVMVVPLAEGDLIVEGRLVDGGDEAGAVVHRSHTQRVRTPTFLAIEPCGAGQASCVYRVPSGAIGVELTIQGYAGDPATASERVAVNGRAESPTSLVHCRDRSTQASFSAVHCLAEFTDAREPIELTAFAQLPSGEILTADAVLDVPDYTTTPDWPHY